MLKIVGLNSKLEHYYSNGGKHAYRSGKDPRSVQLVIKTVNAVELVAGKDKEESE